ncbi:MAG: TetR/AcrR family transcriptional regulator, partial [Litorimonas sp.]
LIETKLTAMNPNELDNNTGWQEQKSAQTRTTILTAAVKCLTEIGYAKTSTQIVAKTANLSRGAMLHHYATKADLISNLIDFINYRRLQAFYHEVKKMNDTERVVEGKAFEVYWRLNKKPESDAHLELTVVSRTDKDLKKLFDKKARQHDNFILDTLPIFFPEWNEASRENLQLAHDISLVTFTGLRVKSNVISSKERRLAVRKLIFSTLQQLR